MNCGPEACGKTGYYPSNIQEPNNPGEHRGYACIRASFGYSWVACSTHLSVPQAYALFQSVYYEDNVLGSENNFRVKLAAGDFNLWPRPHGSGTFGLSHFYQAYWEADNYDYALGINNSTRNPPTSHKYQKIDYVFAGKFWTTQLFGVQDRRCATNSDHCLIIGTFRWRY